MRACSRDMFCRTILRYVRTMIRFTNEKRLSGPGFDAACITSTSYGLPPDQLVPDISRQLAAHFRHAATQSTMSPTSSQLSAQASQISAQTAQT